MAVAFGLIIAIILIKFKPVYEVTISNEELGCINNKQAFEETIEQEIIHQEGNNIDTVSLNEEPKYELKLINRNEDTDESKILKEVSNNATITYKYYAVTLADKGTTYVNTLEEAENLVNQIKEEYKKDLELDLQIVEKYTNNKDELKTDEMQIAKGNIESEVEQIIEENNLPSINGVKLSVLPVNGIITSRYASRSSIRKSTHTGLDIACSTGTSIKAVADGTVTFAGNSGSYGKIIKISHSNGVETWYAHCSKLYAKVGEEVKAGDVISAVGSTGNSTGPHLHLEIRVNGKTVNPQNYLYK